MGTFIDLFAGIGGFHQALSSFGAKCVFASEWDKFARKTYSLNHGLIPSGDITCIKEKEIPSHDILCAGFPCQPFSIAGKQKGFEDIRGTLFFELARIISYHNPKIVILENVKNFVRHDSGNTFNTVVNTLKSLEYDVHTCVLNSKYFSVPQSRERLYFVCFKREEFSPSSFFRFSHYRNEGRSLILEDVLEDCTHKYLSPQRQKNCGKYGCERVYLPSYENLVGALLCSNSTGVFLKDSKGIRKLSPRECARLQGFPEDFKIPVSDTQAYRQFGNTVSVPVIKSILQDIKNAQLRFRSRL